MRDSAASGGALGDAAALGSPVRALTRVTDRVGPWYSDPMYRKSNTLVSLLVVLFACAPAALFAETDAASPMALSLEAYTAKVTIHAVGGFASTAALGAAGVIGVVHYLEMKNVIHPFGAGEDDESDEGAENYSLMGAIWGSKQNLRWWHVGLVAAGETLYLGEAITGLTMLSSRQGGPLTRHDIHRYAFFVHLSLMAAQVVLGFLETDALSRGLHDQAIAYTGAHAIIGIAIPAVMLSAGLLNLP